MFCFSTDFDLQNSRNLQKPAMDIYFVKKSVCKTIFHKEHIFNGDLFFIFRSFYLSLEIKKALKNQPNKHQKINLVCPNDTSYIIGQWAIWMSGNIVVPISGQHTDNALEYFINDSESSLVISSPELMHKVRQKLPKTVKNSQKVAKIYLKC